MEAVTIPKKAFTKILTDVEMLIDDVEIALNQKVTKRMKDIDEGKTEEELDSYLHSRFG